MLRRLLSASAAALFLFTSACSHYRLGTGSTRDYESIFIAPVDTNAAMPQSTAILTTQIRETFIRDGRLRVVNTPDEADAVLTVKLGKLDRRFETNFASDGGLARKMGLTLDATATLRDPSGQKTWFADRALAVERQIFTDDGSSTGPSALQPVQQTQAEYQIVPQLGEALAAQVRGAVLDTW